MPELKAALKSSLAGARKVAVLGIGSELRGDDAAGMLVIGILEKKAARNPALKRKLKLFAGSTAPENLTGEIKKLKPSHIVIVDSAEMGEKPGTFLFIKPDQMSEGVTFSTHMMPAKILSAYFLKSFKCKITFIGIQPQSLGFGKRPSKNVASAAKEVAEAIISSI